MESGPGGYEILPYIEGNGSVAGWGGTGMTPQQFVKDRLALLSLGAIAFGVLLIVLAETLHWEWTKVFGASLIAAGGMGLGVEAGLMGTRNWGIVDKIKAARLPVSYFIIAFTTVPVIAVLLVTIVGMFGDTGDAGALGVVGGALMMLFMLIATLVTVGLAVRSVQRAFRPSPAGSAAEDTLEQPREGDAS